jgi:hypothetical protein
MHNTVYRITFLGIFAELQKVTLSFVMSICLCVHLSTWDNSVPTAWVFMKFNI